MTAAAACMCSLFSPRPCKTLRPPQPKMAYASLLVFLAENRPVFVRLRTNVDGRALESTWLESIRLLAASLDRNGDGTLTTKEADPAIVDALVRLSAGAVTSAWRARRAAERR